MRNGGTLKAVNNEEAAGRALQRGGGQQALQEHARLPHCCEQGCPHRGVRLARDAHHDFRKLSCKLRSSILLLVVEQGQCKIVDTVVSEARLEVFIDVQLNNDDCSGLWHQ